jgi:hypothetical protein
MCLAPRRPLEVPEDDNLELHLGSSFGTPEGGREGPGTVSTGRHAFPCTVVAYNRTQASKTSASNKNAERIRTGQSAVRFKPRSSQAVPAGAPHIPLRPKHDPFNPNLPPLQRNPPRCTALACCAPQHPARTIPSASARRPPATPPPAACTRALASCLPAPSRRPAS